MKLLDQRICAWSGIGCLFLISAFMVVPWFVPPPSPSLDAEQIAALYRAKAGLIRIGVFFGLFGAAPYTAFIAVISVQLLRIRGISRLSAYLQLVGGIAGVLVYIFPVIVFGAVAFRPERDPNITQVLNDLGWLLIITNVPTLMAQFAAIALGVLQDKSAMPVYPRWIAFMNIWIFVIFIPAPFAFFFKTGPFAWNGLFTFWLPAIAFFIWLLAMAWATLRAITAEEQASSSSALRS